MAYLLYKDYLILAGADRDKFTNEWIPIASITWEKDTGKRALCFLTNLPERSTTADEAVSSALRAAKTWIDRSPS
jgi:hypothetical protein